jgi:peptidase C39-like protein
MECRITVNTTVIKLRPLQSYDLSANDKFVARIGEVFELTKFGLERSNHYRITLKTPINDQAIWYVFKEHCTITDKANGLDTSLLKLEKPPLQIPYLSQTDNEINPTGACNVTSVAMCLQYLKAPRHPKYAQRYAQFEDELYQFCEDNRLNRHSPAGLVALSESYGIIDNFTDKGSISAAKNALALGKPCIVHGYFTTFGHIIVLCGYDAEGFIVHDPWGTLNSADRYTNKPGRFAHYPYPQFTRLAMPDSYLWLHVLE